MSNQIAGSLLLEGVDSGGSGKVREASFMNVQDLTTHRTESAEEITRDRGLEKTTTNNLIINMPKDR